MILHTLKKIAIALEFPRSRPSGLIVRELVSSKPGGGGNALSKAYAELRDASDRKSFRFVISVVIRLYEVSKGFPNCPSENSIEEASRRVKELESKLRTGQQDREDLEILSRHREIAAGTLGYSDLLQQLRGNTNYSRSEYDAFKARCKRLFKREGLEIPSQKRGRKPRKETFKGTLKRPRKE